MLVVLDYEKVVEVVLDHALVLPEVHRLSDAWEAVEGQHFSPVVLEACLVCRAAVEAAPDEPERLNLSLFGQEEGLLKKQICQHLREVEVP